MSANSALETIIWLFEVVEHLSESESKRAGVVLIIVDNFTFTFEIAAEIESGSIAFESHFRTGGRVEDCCIGLFSLSPNSLDVGKDDVALLNIRNHSWDRIALSLVNWIVTGCI